MSAVQVLKSKLAAGVFDVTIQIKRFHYCTDKVVIVRQVVGGGLEAEILQDQVRRGRDRRGFQAQGGEVVRRGSLLGAALLLPGKSEKSHRRFLNLKPSDHR